MKTYLLLAISCCMLFACSRKTVPAKTNNATIVTNGKATANNNAPVNNDSGKTTITDTSAAVNNSALAFIVITNGYGKILTQKDSLPADANVQYNQFELS
ncbi:MAG TPA: hypothetical protein VGI61_08325, partial [Parafilimonas sp.]